MSKKKIFNFVRIFVSVALLSFLVYRNRGNFEAILNTLKNLDIRFLVLAFLLYSIGISFIVFRWGALLRGHGYKIFRPFLWQSAFIGWFYNMLLPTSVGGDFYRVYDLYENKGVPMNENISAVVMERIMGSLTGMVYLILAYFLGTFDYLTRNTFRGLLAGLGVILAFFTVLFFPRLFKIDVLLKKIKFLSRIRPKLRDFHDMLTSYRYKKRHLIIAFCYSLLIQAIFMTSYYCINLSMGMGLQYRMMVFTLPFVQIASSVPIAIGGMGIRENAAVFVLESFGAARSDATLFSFIILSIFLFNALLGGLVYVIKNIFYKSKGFI
jgi:uncharacterized protein (TIRG00374 family)